MRSLAPLLLLAACGSGTVTAQAFPRAFAQAVCEVQSRCRAEAAFLEQGCEEEVGSIYGADLAKALAAGKSKFDAAQAQACIDGLRARGCQRTPPEVDQACERAVLGTLPAGASCNWRYECGAGRCVAGTPGACPAKCATVAGENEPCGPCDLRAGLRCIDNVCSKLHGAGQKCTSIDDCAVDLYCDALGQCAPRASEQAACESDEQCARGLFCDLSPQGGLCRRKIASGQACAAGSAGAIRGACVDGNVCRGFDLSKAGAAAGTCAPAGEIGAGCVAGVLVTGCAEGLVCSGGKCADKPVSGPCAQAGDCKDGVAYCDGAQCHLLKPDGATCAASPECASRFCEPASGTCVFIDPACHEP